MHPCMHMHACVHTLACMQHAAPAPLHSSKRPLASVQSNSHAVTIHVWPSAPCYHPCTPDTVYLPALQIVGRDLHADETQVAASVSVFMFTVGIGNLFW